ncbi:hypothetical protein LSTR_LSTR013308 [Laodelphax striatellus]|uniref:MADF domain-containing protein n=1 Tax=Laodelphax striatellus TaxID=195883 RepID=A0A482WEW3_LAOST|nr:hypothetical protein LSTR_LSTR013308 [Laodelphax striatellus]
MCCKDVVFNRKKDAVFEASRSDAMTGRIEEGGTVLFDVLKFINAVRDQKLLWDKHDPSYLDKFKRSQSWAVVGKQMFADWDEAKPSQRNSRVITMKRKYRNLADYYKRIKRLEVEAPQKLPKKRSSFHEELSFLGDTYPQARMSRRSRQNVEDLTEVEPEATAENVEDEEEFEIEFIEIGKIRSSETNGSHLTSKKQYSEALSDTETPEATRKPNKFNRHHQSATDGRKQYLENPQVAQKRPENNQKQTTEEDDNSDRLFLLSMLNDFKNMTENEKLDFKIMCLQFFKNVRQRHDLMNNAMPLLNRDANCHYVCHRNLAGSSNSNNFPVTTNLHHQQNFAGSPSNFNTAGGEQEPDFLQVEKVFSIDDQSIHEQNK